MNRSQLEQYITDAYASEAETPWRKHPSHIVFRHSNNQKWFALLLDIPEQKLGLSADGMVDVVNLKCDPLLTGSQGGTRGFSGLPYEHKERWLSVLLDGSVVDETMKMLLDMSFELTA